MKPEECGRVADHTPCPSDYLGWHEWANEKGKTHTQHRCPQCRLWTIWKPKAKAASGETKA